MNVGKERDGDTFKLNSYFRGLRLYCGGGKVYLN